MQSLPSNVLNASNHVIQVNQNQAMHQVQQISSISNAQMQQQFQQHPQTHMQQHQANQVQPLIINAGNNNCNAATAMICQLNDDGTASLAPINLNSMNMNMNMNLNTNTTS